MITDADIKKLKDSFKGTFATKDDLKQFATKDDLKQFATKDDLKDLVTKKNLEDTVRRELVSIQDVWIIKITDGVAKTVGGKIDKMYVKLDKFIGDIETKRTEQKLHAGQHRKINDRLDITENKLGIPQQI